MKKETMENLDEEIEVDSSDLEEIDNTDENQVVHVQPDDRNREEHQQEDYEYARSTMKNIIADGQKAMGTIVEEIESGGTPRHYEVLSSLIKNISDVSKDLIDLQKQMNEIEHGGKTNQNAQAIQNNHYYESNEKKRTTQEIIDALNNEEEDSPQNE